MNFKRKILFFGFLILCTSSIVSFSIFYEEQNDHFLSYVVDLNKQDLKFFWQNPQGEKFKQFQILKDYLSHNNKKLIFAMNGGMYKKDFSPQGLYIENKVELSPIDTFNNAYGNFYMQPNGVLYITNENKAFVCKTGNFINKNIKYATQSGPMLLIDGSIHPKFNKQSKSLNIRNGVGILPNGNMIFVISTKKVNFYSFANYFKSLSCKNALYLDGFVSRTYLPAQNWNDLSGNFGVIIAEIE